MRDTRLWCRKLPGREMAPLCHHPMTWKLCPPSSNWVPFSDQARIRQQKERNWLCLSSAVHKIYRASNPIAPMAISLWVTFTLPKFTDIIYLVVYFIPFSPRQPTQLTTTNAVEIKRWELGVNTCLGTTCHGSNWSVAGCSQTGICSLLPLIDLSSAWYSLSHWLSLGNQCVVWLYLSKNHNFHILKSWIESSSTFILPEFHQGNVSNWSLSYLDYQSKNAADFST